MIVWRKPGKRVDCRGRTATPLIIPALTIGETRPAKAVSMYASATKHTRGGVMFFIENNPERASAWSWSRRLQRGAGLAQSPTKEASATNRSELACGALSAWVKISICRDSLVDVTIESRSE
ncbi:hypothetical protein [Bradyrhizobium sp.]|jgi:hypothetical protein